MILDSETAREIRGGYPPIAEHLSSTYHEAGRLPISGGKRFVIVAEDGRTRLCTFGANPLPCYAVGNAA